MSYRNMFYRLTYFYSMAYLIGGRVLQEYMSCTSTCLTEGICLVVEPVLIKDCLIDGHVL